MIKLSIVVMVYSLITSCRVSADYNWATVEEQAQRAGVVFKAKVTRHYGTVNSGRVSVSGVEYYKGCGPSSGIVQGFRSSAACGIDRPQIGSTMIFFVCDDGFNWTLNDIAVATGAVEASAENIEKVETATEDEIRCWRCNCRLSKKCTKRPVDVSK